MIPPDPDAASAGATEQMQAAASATSAALKARAILGVALTAPCVMFDFDFTLSRRFRG